VGPGKEQDIDQLDPGTKRGLARAAVDGRKMLNEVIRSGDMGKKINYWSIPPKDFGTAGLHDDFLLRGSLQCLGGIIANDPAEAVYFNTSFDGVGQSLDGAKKYVIRFEPDQLPDVRAFWSMTLYAPTYNFTPNPIHRYSIGDRSKQVKNGADGSLTIYVQNTSPGADKESNWLPSTKSGLFYLLMRTYIPGPAILAQTWAPPGVVEVQ
jgi:hypothetical protein